MPRRARALATVLLLALPLGACFHRSQGATLPKVDPAVLPAAVTLGPGDVIEVKVYGEPELSGVYVLGRLGDVTFPLCRSVVLGGLSGNGAAEKIRECLQAGFMRDPQVSVIVKEYNSKKVFVFGEVQKPGTFPYEDGMSIVQAITVAGGFTKTASRNSTSVTRRVNGQEVTVKVSVEDIALGKAPNFARDPGDIVYVPESLF